MVDLLRWRAAHQPEQQAYTFLTDGDGEAVRLTYAQLDQQARAIAAQLQSVSAPGDRALLLYPPGLDFVAAFFGCLYADVIAVPAYPPHGARMERTLPRIRSIVHNARPQIALTVAPIMTRIAPALAHDPDFQALQWVASDTIAPESAAAWRQPDITSTTLAFLQYTSGSTAAPKGVMVSHGNLLHNERIIKAGFGHHGETLVVGWLPLYHDMGLIGNVLHPLYLGQPCVLMSPVAFLQSPFRWLQAISHYKATTSGGPNFAYDLCARKITPEQRATLDLSHWKVAFNGAEPIRAETMERFAATFAECGFRREAFYPCYGLAEATLFVTGASSTEPPVFQTIDLTALERDRIVTAVPDAPNAQTLVSSGQIWLDQTLAIVEPTTRQRCAPDQVGEIWVAGPSVAQGYWNQPAETEYTFRAYTADTGEGPFLRTGDLGFVRDGELFVTGRLKDLIIIRGRNHYPQDIELTVERSHPALRPGCGAAFALNKDCEERLVVVQEVEREHRNTPIDEMAAAIRKAVADAHELQVYGVVLLKPGGVPKTSSGKIQRSAARQAFLADRLDTIGSNILEDTATEQIGVELSRASLLAAEPAERESLLQAYLRSQVAHVLGVSLDRVEPHQPTSTLGIDSLMAVELQHTIETQLEVVVPMVSFLEERTLAQLAAELLAQIDAPQVEIELVAATDEGAEQPLSHGQRALWFLHQLAPNSSAYHIASAVRIRSDLDLSALRQAFQTLVERHPALRTTFSARQGEPFQRVQPQMELSFGAADATGWSEAELATRLTQETQRPFDLERGPLLRIDVFTRGAQEHVLLLVVHHIVADLWSLAVLTHELGLLYPAIKESRPVELAAPTLHYTDYARWQNTLLAGPEGERLARYWQQQLADAPTVLNLPTDHPRPSVQTYNGGVHSFTLDPDATRQLKAVAQTHGTTLFTTLLAAFQVLLYRYTGQPDLLVGSPTAGRSRADFANLVGYLVNPVVLRANLADQPNFAAFLAQVRQTVLAAFAHQAYPFPTLVERLQPERDPSRSPLFQVMFVLQQAQRYTDTDVTALALGDGGATLNVGGLELESVALEQPVAQFDVTLMLAETARGLAGAWQYNADLFDAATIARMAGHFQTLLASIAANPEQPIAELPLLTEAERQRMLIDWNRSEAEYPRDAAVHTLIEAQAARTPDVPAIVFEGAALTYAELNTRANQLAHHLRAQGVGPDVLVALCVERSLEMIVGMLAILKAGGAYVPLDPAYPQERLQYMLSHSRAPVLLTQAALVERLPEHTAQVFCLDADWPLLSEQPTANPARVVLPDHLAYIIFTSGSTGRPKGVMVRQQGLINLVYGLRAYFDDPAVQTTGLITSISFDISVNQIFPTLFFGRTLHIIPDPVKFNSRALLRYLHEQQVHLLDAVPSYMQAVLNEVAPYQPPNALRYLVIGGEKLEQRLLQAVFGQFGPQVEVVNIYGLTEISDINILGVLRADDLGKPVTVGTPLQNNRIYILDQHHQPQAIGIAGEVCVSGESLSRGYLFRPELTAERFVPCPFEDGQLMVRTGDLGRWRADGTVEILGRIDHQVKIRGFRIETGEIEAVLAKHPQVNECVVVAREDTPPAGGHPEKRLVAYIEPRTKNKELETPSAELRVYLAEHLPDYMVPSAFVVLDTLPKTPNGKIDRKALPAPDLPAALEDSFVAPRTTEEQIIAGIWAEVLGLERVGVYDNFFELGGHSLKATQVMARVQDVFRVELPLHTLFEEPTISRLAQVVGH
ncbi:MAG TPA: amino acid adenylation domain-containing protein, partial [Herpetosiphonaceae bacterium]